MAIERCELREQRFSNRAAWHLRRKIKPTLEDGSLLVQDESGTFYLLAINRKAHVYKILHASAGAKNTLKYDTFIN